MKRPVPGDRHEDADLRQAARAILYGAALVLALVAGGVALALWLLT